MIAAPLALPAAGTAALANAPAITEGRQRLRKALRLELALGFWLAGQSERTNLVLQLI